MLKRRLLPTPTPHVTTHRSLRPRSLVLHSYQSGVGTWWLQIQYCLCSKWPRESCRQSWLPKEPKNNTFIYIEPNGSTDESSVEHSVEYLTTSSVKPMFRKHSWIASNCSVYSLLDTMSCMTLQCWLSMYLQMHIMLVSMTGSERQQDFSEQSYSTNLGGVLSGSLYVFSLSWWYSPAYM